MAATILIIGAGQTGGQAATSLRDAGFDGRIIVIGGESHLPYARTPLTRELLTGEVEAEHLLIHDQAHYDERRIELVLGRRVVSVDLSARRASLDDGRELAWDRLLFATGSRARRLEVPGVDGPGVHILRTIEDARALRADFAGARQIAVIGGGWIGLQATSVLRAIGLDVTIFEGAEHLLARVAAPEVAAIVRVFHATRGVRIFTETAATGFERDPSGRLRAVLTQDGRRFAADVALISVGAVPNAELARAAGVKCEDGVLVDERGQTSAPGVFAAGDCTRHFCPSCRRMVRLESWRNARDQAIAIARAMAGEESSYDAIPHLVSQQGTMRVEIVGAPERWEQVMLRGSPWIPECTAFYLHDGVVVGTVAFNRPDDVPHAKRLMRSRAVVDPRVLLDDRVPLADVAARYGD